jgi:hypothetical protein
MRKAPPDRAASLWRKLEDQIEAHWCNKTDISLDNL